MEVYEYHVWRYLAVVLSALMLLFLRYNNEAQIKYWRRKASSDLAKIKSGNLPFILYLRDFDVDQEVKLEELKGRFNISVEMPILNYELKLAKRLKAIGGFYAIRNKRLNNGMIGLSMESFEDHAWQQEVLAAMRKAILIIYRPSGSPGTFWEFTQLLEHQFISKTVFLITKNLKEPDGTDMYNGFQQKAIKYSYDFPDLKYNTTYLWIDKDLNYHITSEFYQVPKFLRNYNVAP